MIGLFLGTSEGRKILESLNQFTDNIYVSTATEYGGEIIEHYRYKHLNTIPLTQADMERVAHEWGISIIVDASHPYATVVTENIIRVCEKKKIEYLRYERPSVVEKYIPHGDIVLVREYEELEEALKKISGTIMNTTGSNNVEKFMQMKLPNKIIHKVLPTKEVLSKLSSLKVPIQNIIAVYGGGSKNFNKALFEEHGAEAIILKDSGKEGKTEEKIEAALELGLKIFIIKRKQICYNNMFESEIEIARYIKNHVDRL